MTRAQLLTAAVLIACGCSESSVGPTESTKGASLPEPVVITGTISIDAAFSPSGLSLLLPSGDLVDLVGTEAQRLIALDGAEVQLRGTWTPGIEPPYDTDVALHVRPAFAVTGFLVLAVGGRPAMDGLLGQEDGRYFVQLIPSGEFVWFEYEPPGVQGLRRQTRLGDGLDG